MVDIVNYKKIVGNICLHQELAPQRRFLRRNLREILDSHERQLHNITNAGSHEDMIANEKRTSGWDFPTREMLEDLMKGQNPILQLDSLQIRHPNSRTKIQKRLRNQTNGRDGLEWLPDPHADFRLPCRVGINVYDTRGTGTNRPKIDTQYVAATIAHDPSSERFANFNIELRQPFLLEHDKFFLVAEQGTNGFRHWKRTITAKYGLEISIQCLNSEDTAEMLSRIEDKNVSDYDNAPPNEGVLKAVWENLPECPPEGHLLALKRPRGHKSLELDYKLEVAMGWARKRESPLQKHNQKFTEAQKASRQLPTPSASDDLEVQPPKKFIMSYNFQDGLTTKTATIEGLFCPFCPKSREHPTLDRYRLHLMTFHDHFRFELEEPNVESSSTIRRTLWIILADEESDKARKIDAGPREEIDHNWVAPSRSFNISEYVRGTDKWGRQSKGRSGTRKGKSARDKDRDYMSITKPQPIRKRPAPEEVEGLPDHRPRKRKVHNVPGVAFYHTTSKQAMSPGEYVAESDEYVDESWLAQNQTFGLAELGITGAAQEFTNAFNKHLAREQSDSSILTREGLVRFARMHLEQLQDIEWQRQFRAKLNQLREAGVVGDETVSYCVRQLRAASEAKNTDVEMESVAGAETEDDTARSKAGLVNGGILQRPRKKWMGDKLISHESNSYSKGKAPMLNGGSTTDDHPMEEPNTNGEGSSKRRSTTDSSNAKMCFCGSSATHARGSIACVDPVSTQSLSWKIGSN